jgi:S1-C subfamily serine protease
LLLGIGGGLLSSCLLIGLIILVAIAMRPSDEDGDFLARRDAPSAPADELTDASRPDSGRPKVESGAPNQADKSDEDNGESAPENIHGEAPAGQPGGGGVQGESYSEGGQPVPSVPDDGGEGNNSAPLDKGGDDAESAAGTTASDNSEIPFIIDDSTLDEIPFIEYRWKNGKTHDYSFDVTIGSGGSAAQRIAGSTRIKFHSTIKADDESLFPDEEQEGNGSGFVVHPDGFLVTCAHVVKDAVKIRVKLGGREYTAKVIASIKGKDLALIKINANGLTPLPIGDSDKVRLAEDCHAFGFPFADSLGSNLKITRGTISGIEGKNRFQIDAAINPGNSGGPLMNGFGEVIGVTSAKMVGSDVTAVGFAIQSNEVGKFLDEQKVTPQKSIAPIKLDGPDLAAKAQAAVALILVTAKPSPSELFMLTYDGQVSGLTAPPGVEASAGRISDQGQLTVSEFGRLREWSGQQPLPYGLGPTGALPIENMESEGQRNWGHISLTTVSLGPEAGGQGGQGTRRGRFSTPAPTSQGMPAVEAAEYKIVGRRGNQVTIEKTYNLRTLDDSNLPALQISGKGHVVFDLDLGVCVRSRFSGTVRRTAFNSTQKSSLNVNYLRKNTKGPPVVAGKEPPKKSAKSASGEKTPAAANPDVVKKIEQWLADLKSDDAAKTGAAILGLSMTDPAGPRAQVAEALLSRLRDEKYADNRELITAMGRWAVAESIPGLSSLLNQSKSVTLRHSLIRILGQIRTLESAKAIAARLVETADRSVAGTTLRAFGAAAEEAVWPTLEAQDASARLEACKVLQSIGTAQSVARLKALQQSEKDPQVRKELDKAIIACENRK